MPVTVPRSPKSGPIVEASSKPRRPERASASNARAVRVVSASAASRSSAGSSAARMAARARRARWDCRPSSTANASAVFPPAQRSSARAVCLPPDHAPMESRRITFQRISARVKTDSTPMAHMAGPPIAMKSTIAEIALVSPVACPSMPPPAPCLCPFWRLGQVWSIG